MQEGWRSVERVQESVRGLEKVENVLVGEVLRAAPEGFSLDSRSRDTT